MAPRSNFMKHWFAVEAIPIYVAVGGACVGASWYLYRLATGPTVVWTKNNPHPFLSIEQDQGTKLYEVNHKFDKSWKREKL
ncbi:hypothetical protein MIND_00721900 [Mycena indigotica]|uniref:Uncharacterized protein n=1 Tax=Mycena indigotica TaxID=2126181 RepID=A0A8H6SLJ7_9AGAR|nr:uncharacterized protein MIND_00721900 [Mycena indigotica]KAF7301564.1 hypothetical protein MIND_00721900 [Mycena indigotica]